ncbi:aminoacylase 1-like protein 2 [Irpex lacteus]|nr:aminoacylase 1-like protein 2 [Irpex lacteus]
MAEQSKAIWEVGEELALHGTGQEIYKPEFFETIQDSIKSLDPVLRELSLDISAHPELRFEEHHAHDVLTSFMEKQGFEVTTHHLLETAWVATYTHGDGGRTIGVNSEMDALPGVGHACGHNLIAIAGVAVACAIKSVLQKHDMPGKVVLLGTPGEEGGGGKVILLEKGAYEGMDACLMCHPAPGPLSSASLSSCLAIQRKIVEYHGHTAHAALAPWEGQNALDAAVSAYTSVALLRQQVKPSHRIHGIFEGKDWAPNVIPDYAKMFWYVRGETWADVQALVPRVEACFKAASLATGTKVDIADGGATFDLRQNSALGDEFARVFRSHFGTINYGFGISSASTDFGNVTYALPAIHPGYAIPTEPHGGNHTRAFAKSAASPESHAATLNVSRALAAVGVRVLTDDAFFSEVKKTFEQDKKARGAA